MKVLYEFTVNKKVKEKVEGSDEVQEKNVPQYFVIRKPNRSMFDSGELFYGAKVAEGVKANLLTQQMLSKRYLDDGGSKSNVEEQYEKAVYSSLLENQLKYQELESKKDRTKEEEEELIEVRKEIAASTRMAQKYEANQNSIFDQTAEARARNKTMAWWTLQLAYRKVEAGQDEQGETLFNYEPVFKGETYEDKMDEYDEMVDSEDESLNRAIKRFMYLISFWYVGRADKPDDFANLEKALKEEAVEDEEIADFLENELEIKDDE
jgi:hypothetical protein